MTKTGFFSIKKNLLVGKKSSARCLGFLHHTKARVYCGLNSDILRRIGHSQKKAKGKLFCYRNNLWKSKAKEKKSNESILGVYGRFNHKTSRLN